jgi:hypothetical protein
MQCDELEQVHPRFAMDWVRGVWTSQDRRTGSCAADFSFAQLAKGKKSRP